QTNLEFVQAIFFRVQRCSSEHVHLPDSEANASVKRETQSIGLDHELDWSQDVNLKLLAVRNEAIRRLLGRKPGDRGPKEFRTEDTSITNMSPVSLWNEKGDDNEKNTRQTHEEDEYSAPAGVFRKDTTKDR